MNPETIQNPAIIGDDVSEYLDIYYLEIMISKDLWEVFNYCLTSGNVDDVDCEYELFTELLYVLNKIDSPKRYLDKLIDFVNRNIFFNESYNMWICIGSQNTNIVKLVLDKLSPSPDELISNNCDILCTIVTHRDLFYEVHNPLPDDHKKKAYPYLYGAMIANSIERSRQGYVGTYLHYINNNIIY